jgi:hypothetical protein
MTVLSDAGVEVPPPGKVLCACDTLMAADKIALRSVRMDPIHLFENVMIGSLVLTAGARFGQKPDWSTPEVTAALENFSKALSYTNDTAQLARLTCRSTGHKQ